MKVVFENAKVRSTQSLSPTETEGRTILMWRKGCGTVHQILLVSCFRLPNFYLFHFWIQTLRRAESSWTRKLSQKRSCLRGEHCDISATLCVLLKLLVWIGLPPTRCNCTILPTITISWLYTECTPRRKNRDKDSEEEEEDEFVFQYSSRHLWPAKKEKRIDKVQEEQEEEFISVEKWWRDVKMDEKMDGRFR